MVLSSDSFSGLAEMASGSAGHWATQARPVITTATGAWSTVDSDQTHLAAEPRTTEVHNSLAVYTAIKPGRLVGEELYHLCKGSKTIQSSPIDIGLACYDELHMDINMSSVFVQLRQGIMTVCQEGQTVLPPALNQKEYPSFKRFKTQKDEAVLKLQENEKKIINFLPQPKPWEESQRTLQT